MAAARPGAPEGEDPKSEKPDATGALPTSAPPAAAVPGVPGQAVKPEAPTRADGVRRRVLPSRLLSEADSNPAASPRGGPVPTALLR